MLITTFHPQTEFTPAHIRLRNTVWNKSEFEVRDWSLSYYQQAKAFVERLYKGRYASHGRPGVLGDEPENVWYKIAA